MGNKIIFKTQRWSDFLSRVTRGMPIAASSDTPSLRFQDEVFERIYTGDEETQPAEVIDRAYAGWALGIHNALSASPTYQQILAEAKGNALRSAIAIDALLKNLPPPPPPPPGGRPGKRGEPGDQPPPKGKGPGKTGGQPGDKGEGDGEPGDGEPEEPDDEPANGDDSPPENKPRPPPKGKGKKGDDSPPKDDDGDEPSKSKGGKPGESTNDGPPSNSYGTGDDATSGESDFEALPPPADFERKLKKALTECKNEIDNVEAAVRGLGGGGFKLGDDNEILPKDVPEARLLGERYKASPTLKRIVELAGRMRRVAAKKRQSKSIEGNQKPVGVENGNTIHKLLPSELARLGDEEMSEHFYDDYAAGRTLQYQKESRLTQGHGPIVMLLDKSTSMNDGEKDAWQTAISIAMLEHARKQRRMFAVMGFGGDITFKKLVKPGEPLPIEYLTKHPSSGDTRIDNALKKALDVIESERRKGGKLGRADIILITDGESSDDEGPMIRRRSKKLDCSIIAIGIGNVEGEVGGKATDKQKADYLDHITNALRSWTDDVRAVVDLTKLDDGTAEALFAPKAPVKPKPEEKKP